MLSSADVRTAMWISILPAIVLAAVSVLAPLQQHGLGAGPGEIAATFGAAALDRHLVRPLFGRWSDRQGPLRPIRLGAAGERTDRAGRALGGDPLGVALFVIGALV